MHGFLKQSTASQTRTIGPFIDDTDFKTTEDALTINNTDVKLKKNGAASANKNSGGATADGTNGMYHLTFDATDTDTVGELGGSVKVSGALAVVFKFTVLEEAVYDALFASSAAGPALASDYTSARAGYIDNISGHTAQTGDSFARLGAPSGASVSADIADVPTVAEFEARTLLAASYFDPAADTVANVTTVATTTNLTNLPSITAGWITAAGIAASALDGKGDWNTVVPDAAGTVATDGSLTVTLANAVQHGGSTATLELGTAGTRPAFKAVSSSSSQEAVYIQNTAASTGTACIMTSSNGYALHLQSNGTDDAALMIGAGSGSHGVEFDVTGGGDELSGEVFIASNFAASSLDGKGDWNTTTPLTAAGMRSAVGLAAANLDTQLSTIDTVVDAIPTLAEILAGGDVDGFTVEESLKLILSANAAKLSGAATTTVTIRASDDSKDRITASVDASGNRTAVTLDASG